MEFYWLTGCRQLDQMHTIFMYLISRQFVVLFVQVCASSMQKWFEFVFFYFQFYVTFKKYTFKLINCTMSTVWHLYEANYFGLLRVVKIVTLIHHHFSIELSMKRVWIIHDDCWSKAIANEDTNSELNIKKKQTNKTLWNDQKFALNTSNKEMWLNR